MKIRNVVAKILGVNPARESESLKELESLKVKVKELESLKVKELESLKVKELESLKEVVEILKESNSAAARTSLKPVLFGAIATFLSVFLAVFLTQKTYDWQEESAVLRLLKVSESDVKKAIDDIDRIGEGELNTDDSQGCLISHWSDPNATSPYPKIFADVITDQRVISNLSDVNLPILYSYETKLESSLDAIKRKSYDHPIKETNYAIYRDELKILQLTLSDEIKYQKGELSEKQLAKASESFESEARKDSPFKNAYVF